MNTFGKNLTLTTFGESHGPAMGGIIDGFPPGFKIDFDALYEEVAKRRPGQSVLTTARNETDRPEFLSGISTDGYTLGTPIGFIVRNADHRSGDYDEMASVYRPNHADYTYIAKYGLRDPRGGGRQSARETVNWVVAGALAQQWLASKGIRIQTVLSQAGSVSAGNLLDGFMTNPETGTELKVEDTLVKAMEEEIFLAKKSGESIGGRVSCLITGMPAGVGAPVAEKLHARLAGAMMSINATKGFEYGLGFRAASARGSETADAFLPSDNPHDLRTATNFSGGIQGGISNGMPIFFSVYFKPTPTVMKPLKTVDTDGHEAEMKPAGRHDPCVAFRGVHIVKAMTAIVLIDAML